MPFYFPPRISGIFLSDPQTFRIPEFKKTPAILGKTAAWTNGYKNSMRNNAGTKLSCYFLSLNFSLTVQSPPPKCFAFRRLSLTSYK
mgnify:FL=1